MEILPRGCGMPKAGRLYLEIPLSDHGIPLWKFLLDPTVPVPTGMAIPTQGMLFVQRGNDVTVGGKPIYDLYDHIGSTYYPNTWDIIAEWMRLGFHQLIPTSSPLNLITEETNYYAVHARAGISEPNAFYDEVITFEELYPECKRHTGDILNQVRAVETCPAILLNDIIGGEYDGDDNVRIVKRNMPSFSYYGAKAPEGQDLRDLCRVPSFFIKLPIGRMARLVFYQDPLNPMHADILEKMESKTSWPVEVREV